MNLTRPVILDLWPIYLAGEASPETRALVEEFLARDPALARSLRDPRDPLATAAEPPALEADHELRTLKRLKRRLYGYPWLLQLALIFSCFAFGRIVADTSWDVSPRNFVITAAIAASFWLAWLVSLYRARRSLVIRLR